MKRKTNKIDTATRKLLAEQMRHFGAGVTTVNQFETTTEAEDLNGDAALLPIWCAVWCCYDDFRTVRMRGEWKIEGDARRAWARCILFLQTGQRYEWPDGFFGRLSFFQKILNLLTFGWIGRRLKPEIERREREFGDIEVWPFRYRWEFEEAKRTPKFLCARKRGY